jgi:hypothetical protein
MSDLKKKIDEEKGWAKRLAQSGFRDEAAQALHRAKLMEAEMEGGDEE